MYVTFTISLLKYFLTFKIIFQYYLIYLIFPYIFEQRTCNNINKISGDIQKNPSMDYKSNSSCSSPGKQEKSTLDRMDRSDRHPAFGAPVPVLPVRNNLRATHFPPTSSRFHFRKGLSSRCSWKCTAIVFIVLFVLLLSIASYMSGKILINL